MRQIALVVFVSMACGGCSTITHEQYPGRLHADRGVVLPQEVAAGLFKQCSRPAPVFSGSLWAPSPTDISNLEIRFIPYFAKKANTWPHRLESYYRQYAGFAAADGRKLIYAHFFIWYTPSEEMQREHPMRWDPYRWKKTPISICDGSFVSFGVVFDPLTGQFSEFELNGF